MKPVFHYRLVIARYLKVFGHVGLFYLFAAAIFKVRWIVPVSKRWGVGHNIFLRLNSSDVLVFDQVFIDEEYGVLDVLPESNGSILDIGANIGLTSIYLSKKYPGKKIYAIEPDLTNFGLLTLNVSGMPNIASFNRAVWGEKVEKLFIPLDNSSEWARQTHADKSENSQAVKAVRIDEFISQQRIEKIAILKMDVEGAELNIFSNDPSPWLKDVGSIVIELHESIAPGCTKAFVDSTAANFHVVATTRELTLVSR